MSGECQKCHEHCLDCQCALIEIEQNIGYALPGTRFNDRFYLCPLTPGMDIKGLSDTEFETYIREDGNFGVRPMKIVCKTCSKHPLDCQCALIEVDHPKHYKGNKFEVIDVIEDFNLDFNLGNAIKYILRAGKKENKIQDLKKAIWYLKRECKNIENKSPI